MSGKEPKEKQKKKKLPRRHTIIHCQISHRKHGSKHVAFISKLKCVHQPLYNQGYKIKQKCQQIFEWPILFRVCMLVCLFYRYLSSPHFHQERFFFVCSCLVHPSRLNCILYSFHRPLSFQYELFFLDQIIWIEFPSVILHKINCCFTTQYWLSKCTTIYRLHSMRNKTLNRQKQIKDQS